MQIEIPFVVVNRLQQLLNKLADAHDEMKREESPMELFYDTKITAELNSDPVDLKAINGDTFQEAKEIRRLLRMNP